MEENDDIQLVERAQAGDREAFKELVERYQRKVYGICYGMLKEQEASLDVSQEVFLKVYRYLEKFNKQVKQFRQYDWFSQSLMTLLKQNHNRNLQNQSYRLNCL